MVQHSISNSAEMVLTLAAAVLLYQIAAEEADIVTMVT